LLGSIIYFTRSIYVSIEWPFVLARTSPIFGSKT
jgi:hypothetical protein